MDEIDRQITEFEEHPLTPKISIDQRVNSFWEIDFEWMALGDHAKDHQYSPIKNGLDYVYDRYTLGIKNQGLSTDDYWVMDNENPYFEVPLVNFLDEHERGNLPVNMTDRQRLIYTLKSIGISITSVAMLIFAAIIIYNFIINPVDFAQDPSGDIMGFSLGWISR